MARATSAEMAQRLLDKLTWCQQGRPVREIPRDYIRVGAHPPGSEPVVADMVEKLEDYSADVVLAPDDEQILDAVDELLGGARIVVVPSGLPGACKRAAARRGRVVREDSREAPIPTLELDEVDAVVTCTRIAVSLLTLPALPPHLHAALWKTAISQREKTF